MTHATVEDGELLASPPVTAAAPLRTRIRPSRRALVDITVALGYLALALGVMSNQWRHLNTGYLIKSGQDQTMWEWFFAVTAHSLAHLHNPLGTDLQNHPLGVNMMANTAMFGVSVPLAPVTLLFGATVTYVLVLTLGLCSTAFGWYWLFSREVVRSRFAAALGGLFCGFAPGMVSHANGHPNFVVLGLLPVIAIRLIRLTRSARRIRDGVVLGVLLAVQIGLGEEPLLIFAVAFAVFVGVYYARAPRDLLAAARRLAVPVCVAGGVAVVITGVALWWQFFGAQSYHHIDHGEMGNDLKSLFQFPPESLGGIFAPGQNVGINPTEDNAYFGWPLLALAAFLVVWQRRNRIAVAAGVTTAVMAVLSLGSPLKIGKVDTGIPLPWHWLAGLPLFNSILESRFALAAVPAIGVLLALTTERALRSNALIVPWFVGLTIALAPLVPTPLPVVDRNPTPQFFADGSWQQYTHGGSVVIVPLPRPEDAHALHWQEQDGFAYPIAGGYFVGPAGAEKTGKYGPDDRPTAKLLRATADTGNVARIDPHDKANAVRDLRFWHADVLVLPPTKNADALKSTVDELVGFGGHRVDDAWVWDVRNIVADHR